MENRKQTYNEKIVVQLVEVNSNVNKLKDEELTEYQIEFIKESVKGILDKINQLKEGNE